MQQFIVLASPDGVVDMTPQAIAARTSFPLDLILKGIKILSEPDPYTRTPGEEGRRIVLIDDHRPWGWRMVNHGKYMRLRDIKQKREADRARIAEKRSKIIDVAIVSQSVANVAHLDSDSDSDSDSDKNKEEKKHARKRAQTPLPSGFEVSQRVKNWAEGRGYTQLERFCEFFVGRMKANGKTYVDWDEALMNCIREDWPGFRGKEVPAIDHEALARKLEEQDAKLRH